MPQTNHILSLPRVIKECDVKSFSCASADSAGIHNDHENVKDYLLCGYLCHSNCKHGSQPGSPNTFARLGLALLNT